jgi:hypothetical protein
VPCQHLNFFFSQGTPWCVRVVCRGPVLHEHFTVHLYFGKLNFDNVDTWDSDVTLSELRNTSLFTPTSIAPTHVPSLTNSPFS